MTSAPRPRIEFHRLSNFRERKPMSEEQEYQDKIAAVRAILATHLGPTPDNSDQFGSGTFVCAMDYGERGNKGDMVWYISRKDDLLRRRKRLPFEWRAYTADKIAEALLAAYADLAA
jgi:hypothetical protein